ncbi:hypothetical protein [Sulfurisphaera ohwakuensis]|uniref:Uncharacterized protein n=1 Tax=Sulfurisphaera ohwakuensis TaxID=69656 RepID=A0A650CGY5_SULOH|nr:hypothetical protein [Sulfurisphaera ohwakuensis]MBB5252548.1 hypothetical protein [Sulfurisphaera ohwakuensis]QGR17008.1 hypothetical protein D1869_07315 [Sulfurisphaera ohwakuensis]
MKLDDLLKVASDFPIQKVRKISVSDDIFSIEQAPQLISLLNPEEIEWKHNSIIIGPDGTEIQTRGSKRDKEYYYLSPIYESQIGWNLELSSIKSLENMIYDLLPCKEGESYFNPSFWYREDIIENKNIVMESGEINEKLRERNHKLTFYDNNLSLELGYVNPLYTYLNPFIISQSKKIIGKSEFFSISLKETYTVIGENKLYLENNNGYIKVESNGKIALMKSITWKETKPYEIVWNLKNKVQRVDCKLPFPISLYKLYPAGILPFFIKYENHTLTLGLINLNETPIVVNLVLAARIEEANLLSPQGEEIEKLNPEFDRIKIPIRKLGIVYIRLKIRKLLESFLKRKIISS